MDPLNGDQIAYWNGPSGERWAREQAVLDRAFAAFTGRLFGRASLRPGERVVDIGCGCGTTTLEAAEKVGPTGAALGIDVSAPMLARARQRSTGVSNVTFLEADASVYPFDPAFEARFDVAISRFGVMFFRDPVAAFANLRTAMRPGARLAFLCWRPVADNEWARVPLQAARPYVPAEAPPGPDEPGPFSFGDSARVERILKAAGFENLALTSLDEDVLLSGEGLPAAVHFAMSVGPTARLLRDVTGDAKARVHSAVEEALRPRVDGDRVALRGATWLVEGKAR